MSEDQTTGSRLRGLLVAGSLIVAVLQGVAGTAAVRAGEPTVIPGESRVVRSGEAAADSLPVGVQSRQATTRSSRHVIASYDAPLYSWNGGAEGDAWYNRPIRDYREPADDGRYRRRYDWADAMWLVILMDRYNHRYGFPLGVGFSGWVNSWNRDCNPRR